MAALLTVGAMAAPVLPGAADDGFAAFAAEPPPATTEDPGTVPVPPEDPGANPEDPGTDPAEPPDSGAAVEERGVWVAYSEFGSLGLANKTKGVFTKNFRKVLDRAKAVGLNAVYFHVRSFDDAAWMSTSFKPNKYLSPNGESGGRAADVYDFDPLQVAIDEAHARGMTLHAWMNPYRVTHDYYYDPAKTATTNRILRAVDELLAYDIDGLHKDDDFYSAKRGYFVPGTSKKYKVKVSAASKRAYCNRMVKAVYARVHGTDGKSFGISPAGNYDNSMSIGADIRAWLSQAGYVDYLAPQIYWTDNWGSDGKTKMFTDRVKRFQSANTLGVPLYIGLAAYRTGYKQSDDKGWGMRNTNLRNQVSKLRSMGCDGFLLFCAKDLSDSNSRKEIAYLQKLLAGDPAAPARLAAAASKAGTSDTAGTTARLATAAAVAGKVVVIDAGHQRKADTRLYPIGPGAKQKRARVSAGTRGVHTGIPEYKVTLEVAKRLEKMLKAEGFTVYMARTKHDVNISNADRARLANRKQADLFIRLHCDATPGTNRTRGFLTLTPENNRWTKGIYKESLQAANTIHKAALKATGAKSRGVVKRGDLAGFNYC
ncbi:MAG: N-acetylmuramoyl-L-alanine amidase, partial [Clostridiales Family XIII bacterium]|nr:N-acetylmuramoyl-L-alanine amidase [Clostridiales Family XIII bacterium]